MTKMRKIPIFAIVAAALGCAPAVAQATPLLSGYGGPGQGNQAILGATLIGGSAGSGSSGGPGGPGGGEVSATSISTPGSTPSSGSRASTRRGSRGAHGRAGSSPASGGTGPAERSFRGYTAAERVGISQPALGLSGEDLLYILLVLAALAFTGVITGRLARKQSPNELGSSRGSA